MPAAFELKPERLVQVRGWVFDPFADMGGWGGRVEVWEEPDPEFEYVIGADFAKGLEGRDYDAAVILKLWPSRNVLTQVAELHGHWGPSFDRLLYAAGMAYNEAFILGEAQEGLDRLRSLHALGYPFLYYNRDEASRSRKISDKLGYWRGSNDVCIPNLRRAVRDRALELRSPALLAQLRKVQYRPRESIRAQDVLDTHLQIKLGGGGSPDLVMALGYAVHAAKERPFFEKQTPKYRPGSAGDIMGHSDLTDPEEPETRAGWRARRAARRGSS